MSSPEAASGSSSDSSSEDEFDLGAAASKPSVVSPRGEEKADEQEDASGKEGGEEGHSKLFSDSEDEDEGGEQKQGKTEKAENPQDDKQADGDDTKEKEMEDLFGSDYDSEEEEFKASGIKESPVRDGDARHNGDAGDRAEHSGGALDDGSLGMGAANELWLPKTPHAPKAATAYVTKMPNILRLVPTAYTAAAIQEEMANPSDETLYRNYVRWRYKRNDADGRVLVDPKTGRPLRESNAKLVQWEDGTLTMFVGKEALHLTRQKLANSFLFVNETASDRPDMVDPEDEDDEVPGQETVLECHSRLDEKLTIRPMTTASKSHKSLTMSMRAKHNKGVQKVKQYISELDGDREQEQRVKIEDEKLRLANRKKARQSYETDRERAHTVSSRMDASFLENDYDDDEHVGAIKQQFGAKGKHAVARKPARRPANNVGMGFDDYSRQRRSRERDRSDSEDDDTFSGRGRAQDAAADDDEEEEEEEEMVFRTHKKRRTVDEDSD